MKAFYDFHIHSALSPCADDDMTPSNIVAMASIKGLHTIAVSDHNSIKNVKAAIECGKDFGITVIPAIEVQTSEDIHILALFYDYSSLENFYKMLTKPKIKNREQVFGNQLIIDEDNEIIGREEYLLLVGCDQNLYTVTEEIRKNNGIAIPAHIDREENGMVAILGDIPFDIDFNVVEISKYADKKLIQKYNKFTHISNSDAHHLEDINDAENYLEVEELSIKSILNSIAGGNICKI